MRARQVIRHVQPCRDMRIEVVKLVRGAGPLGSLPLPSNTSENFGMRIFGRNGVLGISTQKGQESVCEHVCFCPTVRSIKRSVEGLVMVLWAGTLHR